ncbi:MAG: hypothetical protein LBV40_06155 [Methanomicrobiales archaeon]|nr:hypothetical protein [Methanomicrobiales archaeon]
MGPIWEYTLSFHKLHHEMSICCLQVIM